MVQNPNWPLIDEAVSFVAGPYSTSLPYWCSVLPRTEGSWTSQRGRQYELDQVQTGTANATLQNTDGAFDPNNAGSEFYPYVTPYRPYRRRAQCPPTANILTASQATAGLVTYDQKGVSSSLAAGVLPAYVSGAYGLTTTGAGSYRNTVPSSPATGTRLAVLSAWSFKPGRQYTISATISATAAITLQFIWNAYLAGGANASSGAGTQFAVTTTPTRFSGTFTAGSNFIGFNAALYLYAGSAATTVTHTNWQIEEAASVSAYATPSPWYDIFNGYVERWPQVWTRGGTYGQTQITAVDAFGYLSQRKILSPAYMEALALGASWLYPLDEPSGATIFYDLTATQRPIGSYIAQGAAATQCAPGTTLTSTGWLPSGIGGPVVTFANTSGAGGGICVINLASRGVAGPPTGTAWTRIYAFRCTSYNTATYDYVWYASSATGTDALTLAVNSDGSVNAAWLVGGTVSNNATVAAAGATGLGDLHFMAVSMSADGKTVTTYFDGTTPSAQVFGTDQRPNIGVAGQEVIGGNPAGGNYNGGFGGDIAFACEMPFAMTPTQWTQLYSTFRYGGSGLGVASSSTRFADTLRWAGWVGMQSEDPATTGTTTTYGPSTDLAASATSAGTDAVTGLQLVTDTENGMQYVDRSGSVTLKSRGYRYNRTALAATFGESTGSGEIPYIDCSFGLDPTKLANDAAATQTSTGLTTRAVNQSSISLYGDIQVQRNVNSLNALEINDAATFLANINASPLQRVETLTVSPARFTIGGAPSLTAWVTCLALEFGDLVKIVRRPPNAPAITFTGFVESINWSMSDQGDATCTLQVSPQGARTFWQLDSATYSVLGSSTILGY